jgi:hypothetical protein
MSKTPKEAVNEETGNVVPAPEKEKLEPTKRVVLFEDLDSSAMVNLQKATRSFAAIFGGAKSGSVEITLVSRVRSANPGIGTQELFEAVYRGLGGLVDESRAKKNRENEERDLRRKASR